MTRGLLWRSALGLLISLLILSISYFLYTDQISRAALSPLEIDRALQGVSHNQEWAPIQRRMNGMQMVLVPAGCFTMGSTDAQIEVAQVSCDRFFGRGKCQVDFKALEQPTRQICFKQPFWLGLTEVTNRAYGSPLFTRNAGHYRGPSWPVEALPWVEALSFCESLGMRLPSEAEWEYAARGPDARIYPWGDEFKPLNVVWGMLNPDTVGQYEEAASWVGALDMSGSVAEWVMEPFAPYDLSLQANESEMRIARGGSWFSFAPFYLRSAMRDRYGKDFASSVVGFRCAADFALTAQ